MIKLWFDVGIKRYTTQGRLVQGYVSCGLMQESKDIQRYVVKKRDYGSCGLMQESKDIQHNIKVK